MKKTNDLEKFLNNVFSDNQVLEDRLSASQIYSRAVNYDNDGDDIKAYELYLKAAELGHIEAKHSVGLFNISDGDFGVENNFELAIKCFLEAAIAGQADSYFNLGCIYSNAEFKGHNLREAIKYHLNAATQRYEDARDSLEDFMFCYFGDSSIYDVEVNIKIAISLCEKLAKLGSANAQYKLGECYDEGIGVVQNVSTANKYFEKSAKQGNEMPREGLQGAIYQCLA